VPAAEIEHRLADLEQVWKPVSRRDLEIVSGLDKINSDGLARLHRSTAYRLRESHANSGRTATDGTDAQMLRVFSSNSEERSIQRGVFRVTDAHGLRERKRERITYGRALGDDTTRFV
jgi:hypothetical protein